MHPEPSDVSPHRPLSSDSLRVDNLGGSLPGSSKAACDGPLGMPGEGHLWGNATAPTVGEDNGVQGPIHPCTPSTVLTTDDMHGRPVYLIPLTRAMAQRASGCADCSGAAETLVVELGVIADPQPLTWFWCGHCDLGG